MWFAVQNLHRGSAGQANSVAVPVEAADKFVHVSCSVSGKHTCRGSMNGTLRGDMADKGRVSACVRSGGRE